MISKYKPQLTPLIAIIARPFLSWNPSALTLLSLASALLFLVGIVEHIYILSIISMIGFIFDALDGYVARSQHKVTKTGAFLDSTLDRVSDFFFIACFGFAHLVPWELIILVVGTTFLISYLRTRADATFGPNNVSSSGLMQRTERIVFIFLAFFLFLVFPGFSWHHFSLLTIAFAIVLLLNCITLAQRLSLILSIKGN